MQRHYATELRQDHAASAGITAEGSATLSVSKGLDRIFGLVPRAHGWSSVPFNSLALSSHYQPILSVAERAVAGYEGLALAHNLAGQRLAPEILFAMANDLGEGLPLDMLTRALHIKNFAALGGRGRLFINIHPEAASADLHDETAFAKLIAHYGVDPASIVVEILETGVDDEARLRDAVQLYKQIGCQVALDDFGVGFSNFDRLWRLEPDIVKIDRSVMRSASGCQAARRVLNNMVRMVHDCGAVAVVEGVEERRDALIAMETDADFLQGFYFARPGREALDGATADNMISTLMHHFDNDTELARVKASPQLRTQGWLLENMAAAIERGASFTLAAEALLDAPHAVRASLLTLKGEQIASSLNLKRITAAEAQEQRCPCGRGWQLMHMIQSTVAQPGLVRVTRPYLPAVDAEDCVTLSYAFQLNGEHVVLCVDIVWTDGETGPPALIA